MRRLTALSLALTAALGIGSAVAQPLPYAPIPPPRYEVVPAYRNGYIWQPGHWHWNGVQYVWFPGVYVVRRPYYHHWVEGYWGPGPYGRHAWRRGHWE